MGDAEYSLISRPFGYLRETSSTLSQAQTNVKGEGSELWHGTGAKDWPK